MSSLRKIGGGGSRVGVGGPDEKELIQRTTKQRLFHKRKRGKTETWRQNNEVPMEGGRKIRSWTTRFGGSTKAVKPVIE